MTDPLRICVLTGDPRLPDLTKRDHRYNDEDFATHRAMRRAFESATADFAQNCFPAEHAIDGRERTGWAIQGEGNWNVNRAATFTFTKPVANAAGG